MDTTLKRQRVRQSREALGHLLGDPATAAPVDQVDDTAIALAAGEPPPLVDRLRITEPGIYTMRADDYHADPCPAPSLSSSIAKVLCSSTAAHARLMHPRLNPRAVNEEAEGLDIGSLAHAILLEGVNVVEILDFPDWRTKASREARETSRSNGRIPLLQKVWSDVEAMVNATREQLDEHQDGRHMFKNGDAEEVLVWQEPGGLWCRARLDFLRRHLPPNMSRSCVDDYKTTRASANPEDLSRTLFSNGWDVQAAFYLRGLKALTGVDGEFRFACQECFAPYALSVVSLGPAALMLAEKKVQFALDLWRWCLANNRWPGYPNQTAFVSLPPWIESAWLDKEERSAL